MPQVILGTMSGNVPVSSTLDAMYTELYNATFMTALASATLGNGTSTRGFIVSAGSGATEGGYFAVRRGGAASTFVGDAAGIFGSGSGGNAGDTVIAAIGANNQRFYTNGAERMRITAGGNVVVGSASAPDRFTVLGTDANVGGFYRDYDVAGGNAGLFVNLGCRVGSTPTPAVTFGSSLFAPAGASGLFTLSIRSGNVMTERLNVDAAGNTYGGSDNTQWLGSPSRRWAVLYAGTGSINTSDAREKTKVAALTDAELACASELAREIGVFQFLASRDDKGADNARLHVGTTVQRVIEVMESHGLDPMRYAFICYDEWDEETTPAELDADGNETKPAIVRPAGNRYGFRTDQLALFIARGQEERLRRIEERLNANP